MVLCARLLLTGVVVVAALNNPVIQVSGVLLVSLAYLVYLIYAWPSRLVLCKIKLHNWFALLSELALLAYYASILGFVIQDSTWEVAQKLSYCQFLMGLLLTMAGLQIAYLLGRAIYECYCRLWIPLVRTAWFQE